MVTRRTTAPRKRPASSAPALPVAAAAQPVPTMSAPAADAAPAEDAKRQVFAEFQAALRERNDLDADEVELLIEQFKAAVNAAPLDPEVSTASAIDASLLDSIAKSLGVADDERHFLVRKFADVQGEADVADVHVALEYIERLNTQGPEAAMAWLATQRADAAAAATKTSAPASRSTPEMPQTITKSRSRRLRGPPV